jgi:beta-keto acid cleavage enzyme
MVASLCIALGQHTRAGIEENLWTTRKGERMTSVQMIEKHVRIARELGREIATGDDARRIMKLGVTYNSVEETLFNLGLPNRKQGQQGFRVYETDGNLSKPRTAGSDGHPLAGE